PMPLKKAIRYNDRFVCLRHFRCLPANLALPALRGKFRDAIPNRGQFIWNAYIACAKRYSASDENPTFATVPMTTLTEVAKLAGVTAATVCNVLRDRGKVGDVTRKRVLEAVEALGSRPHLTARALAEGSAPTLALMVSSIANPFYPEFALAAERA